MNWKLDFKTDFHSCHILHFVNLLYIWYFDVYALITIYLYFHMPQIVNQFWFGLIKIFCCLAIEALSSLIYVFANIYEIKRFLVPLKYCLCLKSRFSFIFQKKKFWHKDKLVVCDHEACNLCETTNTVKSLIWRDFNILSLN